MYEFLHFDGNENIIKLPSTFIEMLMELMQIYLSHLKSFIDKQKKNNFFLNLAEM